MSILIVRNSETAPEGDFGDWLRRTYRDVTLLPGDALTEAAMRDAGLVVMFGSPRGVYETEIPWIAAQRPLVAARLAARRPTIGVCFGAQMMAAAAGGDVARHPEGRVFRGWLGIEEARDPVLAGLWPRWHGDVITLPPRAELLARDAGTVQAFALPNAVAVQFHPEATPAIMRGWAERAPHAGIDPAALEAESRHLFAARTAAREALFVALLQRAGYRLPRAGHAG